jgi:hypothetical protein
VTRTVTATDGGAASATVSGINIDTTKPTLSIKGPRSRRVYDGRAPKPRCVAKDALSGLVSCVVHQRAHGQRVTVTATATDKAGNVAHKSVTYTVLAVFVRGARRTRSGGFVIRPGHHYLVEAVATQRPRFYLAVPIIHAKQKLTALGPKMTAGPHHLWRVRLAGVHGHRRFIAGVKIGHTLHRIELHPVN